MGGYPDVVCRDERGTGKRQFAIWTQDEGGIHDVHWIREHAPCSAVCVCYLDSNSQTYELETTEVRTGGGVGGRVQCIEGFL